ncbi:MAG: ABC transporter substrate-binding protein, partial [Ktedonobacteraceae bacterium]
STSCPLAGLLTQVAAPDAATITLTTARPVAALPAMLALPCASIVKSTDLGKYGNSAFSTHLADIAFSSTYYVFQFMPGLSLTLKYNEGNSVSSTPIQAAPAQITVLAYSDNQASYRAFQAGQLDMAPSTGNQDSTNGRLRTGHPATLHYYAMNFLAKPFDNIAMRQAFALALDRRQLASLNTGITDLSSDQILADTLLGPFKSGQDFLSLSDDPGTGNPARAKTLFAIALQQEGLSNVSQLPAITFAYQDNQPRLASEIALACQMWQQMFGIQVTPRPMSNLDQALAATRNNPNGLQLWAADYAPAFADPLAWLSLPFGQNSPLNTVNFGQNQSNDAARQQLLQANLAEYDANFDQDQTRLQGYQSVEQQIITDVAWLPISMHIQDYFLASNMQTPFSLFWSPWSSSDY